MQEQESGSLKEVIATLRFVRTIKRVCMTNIERIRRALTEQDFDAILIINPANRLFATGFDSSDGALLVTMDGAWFYTDSRYIEAAAAAISDAEVLLVSGDATYSAQVSAILSDRGITSIGFEDTSVSYAGYLEWKEKLSAALPPQTSGRGVPCGVELVPSKNMLADLRAVKSLDDLEKMKTSQKIAEKSFLEILPLIDTDITEKELSDELLYRFLKNGADDCSFDSIVVSGPKSSMPHGVPGNVKIGKGFLTIDFGVRLAGWCSDTTRTLCVGDPDVEMKKVYNTVLDAQIAGINAARAGIAACDVDSAARAVIENAGYGAYF